MGSEEKKKKSNWLLWWKIDQEELEMQIREYKTLKITKSARGISLLLLLFSMAITVVFVQFFHMDSIAYFDAFIMFVLGVFIYMGHRWAIIMAMLFWTVEKLFQIIEPLQNGGGHSMPNPVVMIIWWAIYMHAFYLALKVENKRKKSKIT